MEKTPKEDVMGARGGATPLHYVGGVNKWV